MKRITPQTDEPAPGYPPVDAVERDRRRFVLTALSGAAAVGGALLLPGEPRAGRRRGTRSVYLPLRQYIRGCSWHLRGVTVSTANDRLFAFLRDKNERAGVLSAVRKGLAAVTCRDLRDRKRRRRVEGKVAREIRLQFIARTKKKTALPKVRLATGVDMPNPGFQAVPSYP